MATKPFFSRTATHQGNGARSIRAIDLRAGETGSAVRIRCLEATVGSPALAVASYPALEGGRGFVLCWPRSRNAEAARANGLQAGPLAGANGDRNGDPDGWSGMGLIVKPSGGPAPDIHLCRLSSRNRTIDLGEPGSPLMAFMDRLALAFDLARPPHSGSDRTSGIRFRQNAPATSRSSLSALRAGAVRKASVIDEWARFSGKPGALDISDPRHAASPEAVDLPLNIHNRKRFAGFHAAEVLERVHAAGGQAPLPLGLARTLVAAGFQSSGNPGRDDAGLSREERTAELARLLAVLVRETGTEPLFAGFEEKVDIGLARSSLASCPDATMFSICWYGSRDSDLGPARRQAASAWPILADYIARRPPVRAAVDAREPVMPHVLEATGLTKGGLKRIGDVTDPGVPRGPIFERNAPVTGVDGLGYDRLRRMSVAGEFGVSDALSVLSHLPPDWAPQSNPEWKAFCEIASGAVLPLQRAYGLGPQDLLRGAKGRWCDYRDQLARACEMIPEMMDRRAIALTAIDALEIADSFGRQQILPLALRAVRDQGYVIPPNADTSILLAAQQGAISAMTFRSKSGLVGLFETARRWITRSHAIMDILPDPRTFTADKNVQVRDPTFGGMIKTGWLDGKWEPMTPLFQAPNALTVVALTSHEELAEESRRLGHCVGLSRHYSDKCMHGTGHILSVRSADGLTSHSTVELAPFVHGDLQFRVLQHQGSTANGRRVPPEATTAWNAWMHAVQAGGLVVAHDDVEAYSRFATERYAGQMRGANRPAARIPWRGICGFEPLGPDIFDQLWEPWKQVLGGEFNKAAHPGSLFRVGEVQQLVEVIAPAAYLALKRQERERKQDGAAPAP